MATQVSSFSNDVHLYPLYLKWAAENFSKGNTSEGMAFFRAVCGNTRILEHKVYEQLWKLRGSPEGDLEYGRKSFHGLSCSSLEKAQAIDRTLRTVDRHELDMRENQVHKCLWIIHGRPDGDLEYGRHAFYNTHGQFSSIADKLLAARKYADESRVLTWITLKEEIQLIKRADGELECLVIDRTSAKIWSVPVDGGGRSVETVIAFLSQCDVTVNGDTVSFSRPVACEEWPERIIFSKENKELKLLWKGNHLIWRLFDNTTKKISWIFARNDKAIRNLGEISETERRSYLKDFNVNISYTYESRLLSVFLDKIRLRSKLDPNKIIDRDNWAITLISDGVSSAFLNRPVDINCGHAKIIYEGVKDGAHFVGYAHFTASKDAPSGCAMVKVDRLSPYHEILYRTKSPTWVRPRASVERIERKKGNCFLFNHSGNEWLRVNAYKKIVDGFIFGCRFGRQARTYDADAIWGMAEQFVERLRSNPEYNCLIWAKEEIELMGIELPPINSFLAVPDWYISSIKS